jgi:rhodanese-related sulfurtransferase
MTVSVITELKMVNTVTPAELVELMTSNDVDLVDVRERDEWEAGHIEGVRLVPLEQFRADPDAVLTHGRAIVFVCAKGVRSLSAAKLVERFGYENLYNLTGGTRAWAEAGLPIAVESSRVAA